MKHRADEKKNSKSGIPSIPRSPYQFRSLSCAECSHRQKSAFCQVLPALLSRLSGKSFALYRKGQVVFHEGTQPLACYCIYSGRVKLYRTGPGGKEQIVSVAKPADLIGHHSLWLQRPHAVSGQMMEDGHLCVIDKATFWDLVQQSPALVREILRRMAEDLEEAQIQLTDRSFRSARSRLAAALLRLWEEKGGVLDRAPAPLVLSRQDLADIIGTAQETAIRLLAELKSIKAVSARGSRITILRPDILRDRSQPPY